MRPLPSAARPLAIPGPRAVASSRPASPRLASPGKLAKLEKQVECFSDARLQSTVVPASCFLSAVGSYIQPTCLPRACCCCSAAVDVIAFFALLLLLSPTAPHPSAPHAPSATAMLACLFGRPPLPPILAPSPPPPPPTTPRQLPLLASDAAAAWLSSALPLAQSHLRPDLPLQPSLPASNNATVPPRTSATSHRVAPNQAWQEPLQQPHLASSRSHLKDRCYPSQHHPSTTQLIYTMLVGA